MPQKKKKSAKSAKGKARKKLNAEQPLLEKQIAKILTEDDIEHRARDLQNADSSFAIIQTSFSYVLNDLRKKKKQFVIGVSAIFLTVTVVTFLYSLVGLAPAVTMIASQSTVGDYDLQFSKRSESTLRTKGNRNFFVEGEEFFEQTRNVSESFQDKVLKQLKSKNVLPVLNFTEFNQTVQAAGHEKIKARFFPRWNALSKVVNTNTKKQTSAVMVAGDSSLENSIGVAHGFPQLELGQDEVIMMQDVMEVLELRVGDEIEISFDLFQAAVSELAKLKKILFSFEEFMKQNTDGST